MKPTIDTDCMAAVGDGDTVRTALLSWPACGPAHGGAVLQLSSTVLPTGQQVGLLDVHVDRARYRDGAQLLVRCAPEHLQAPAQPLGTTLQAHTQHHARRLLPLEQHHARRLLALQQVAAEAEALLDALDGVQLVPSVVLACQRLHHSVQDALEVEHG